MKTKIEYNNIQFDSQEELYFFHYLTTLQENGFVNVFEYNTKVFKLSEPFKYIWFQQLKTKQNKKESTLLHSHIYTPDFYIEWNKKAHNIFYNLIHENVNLSKSVFIAQLEVLNKDTDYEKYTGKIISYCEIKPAWDMQNMTRLFSINCKWVMTDYNIYVQKIIPTAPNKNCLFAQTFIPEKCLYTAKKHQPKKFKYKVKSLTEFINGNIESK